MFNHLLLLLIVFFYIRQRNRLSIGKGMEIDIFAAVAEEVWLAESKWQETKVEVDVIENMLKQKEIVNDQEGEYLTQIHLWLFACNGVTEKAQELINKHNSTLADYETPNFREGLAPLISGINFVS